MDNTYILLKAIYKYLYYNECFLKTYSFKPFPYKFRPLGNLLSIGLPLIIQENEMVKKGAETLPNELVCEIPALWFHANRLLHNDSLKGIFMNVVIH